jgi:hypothetical protein
MPDGRKARRSRSKNRMHEKNAVFSDDSAPKLASSIYVFLASFGACMIKTRSSLLTVHQNLLQVYMYFWQVLVHRGKEDRVFFHARRLIDGN